MTAKQVIVMRKDLNMRKGKMVAQGAHACMKHLLHKLSWKAPFDAADEAYYNGIFKKICVSVNSEEELLQIHETALSAGLKSFLIEDSGLTEFKGVKTNTCLAIGPHFDDQIDPITRHLPLL